MTIIPVLVCVIAAIIAAAASLKPAHPHPIRLRRPAAQTRGRWLR